MAGALILTTSKSLHPARLPHPRNQGSKLIHDQNHIMFLIDVDPGGGRGPVLDPSYGVMRAD